jgi:hypothetical protein
LRTGSILKPFGSRLVDAEPGFDPGDSKIHRNGHRLRQKENSRQLFAGKIDKYIVFFISKISFAAFLCFGFYLLLFFDACVVK